MAPTTDNKRALILEALRRLLVKRGFQDVVLDDVAREAGVAKGTLFLHFKNKDELVFAAFADMMDQMSRSLDELLASGKTGKSLLENTARAVLGHLDRNKDFLSHFGAGRFPGCGDRSCGLLMDRLTSNKDKMVKIVTASLKAMGLQIDDTDFAAVAFFGLCRSALVERVILQEKWPLMSKAESIIDIFLNGIAKKK
jgi:TetR/AcrR family fatty acid metabolism transcriptional regulator